MAWVTDADVQIHLPVDTLKVEEVPDDRANQERSRRRDRDDGGPNHTL